MREHRTGMLARLLPAALLGAALLTALPAAGQSWRTLTTARQVWGTEPVEVRVEYGAGELSVRPAEKPTLYRMEMRYDEAHFSPVSEFDRERRILRLGATGKGERNINVREGGRATIGLTRELPLDLSLDFGAGEAELDLGGMRIRRLDLSTGASETTVRFDAPNPLRAERVSIKAGAAELKALKLGNARAERFDFQGGVGTTVLDFSGRWTHDARARVQMGLGSVVLRFPRGLGVRVNKSSFLTRFDSEGLVKRGASYFSPDWERAARRLTVDVDAAFGSIEVEWVD